MPASKKILKNPHITVEYNDEPFTVVANSIVKLADGIAAMNNSGLTDRAIVLLLHDSTGVNKKEIVKILKAAPLLAERYVRPRNIPTLEQEYIEDKQQVLVFNVAGNDPEGECDEGDDECDEGDDECDEREFYAC